MADASETVYLVVGLAFLGSAAGLLALNFADRLNRVFSLYLVLEGGAMVALAVTPGEWWQAGLRGLFYYLNLAAPYALLYLAACYRDRFGRRGLRRFAFPVLLGAGLLTQVLYVAAPELFQIGLRPMRSAHYVAVLLGPAILAALLARDALATPRVERRRYLLAASLAFAFYPTAFALHLFIPNLMSVRPPEAWIALGGLAPIGYLVVQLARQATTGPSDTRISARNYLGILLLSPISVAVLWWVRAVGTDLQAGTTMRILMTGWLVVLAALVAYAILRHQLFGIEIGVKWTLRRGMVPGALVASFFVFEELLEAYAEAIPGPGSFLAAGLAVGLLSMAYRPLQRTADRFAEATMPRIHETDEYAHLRRRQLFQSALAAAWEDGVLTRAERLRLDRTRDRLGLSVDEAATLEGEYGKKVLSKARSS